MKAWKLSLLAAATMSSAAYATEPMGIEMGSGVKLLPSVELSISDSDNIYNQDSSEAVSSSITRLKPALAVNVDLGSTAVDGLVKGDFGQFSKDDHDDYSDMLYQAGVRSSLNSRNAVTASAKLNQGHDDRGSGTLEGSEATNTARPDQYDETVYDLSYIYGAKSSMLNANVALQQMDKEYQNNRDVTSDRDHSKTKLSARLDVTVSSATKAVVEIRNTEVSYDNSSSIAADGSILNTLVGASWDITGKTTGEVKLGMSDRKFDDSAKDADNRFSWEANVTFSPKSYSVITLTTSQLVNETSSATLGTYIASEYSAVNWTHTFSPFVALKVDASLSSDEYVDASNGRKDDVTGFGISGVFSPSKNIDVTLGYNKSKRDSNISGLDYDKNVIALTLSAAI
ncbi:outer membrane beta-barrel protein [Thalassolituus sp. LLYu03]|uniref:outer membrane beta-barrel protein n=1 Tax=Thalassolituus sp. LLYu03 TaxID=3421656 RepID=UPI003D29D56F